PGLELLGEPVDPPAGLADDTAALEPGQRPHELLGAAPVPAVDRVDELPATQGLDGAGDEDSLTGAGRDDLVVGVGVAGQHTTAAETLEPQRGDGAEAVDLVGDLVPHADDAAVVDRVDHEL